LQSTFLQHNLQKFHMTLLQSILTHDTFAVVFVTLFMWHFCTYQLQKRHKKCRISSYILVGWQTESKTGGFIRISTNAIEWATSRPQISFIALVEPSTRTCWPSCLKGCPQKPGSTVIVCFDRHNHVSIQLSLQYVCD
jgi:hypothetical protein